MIIQNAVSYNGVIYKSTHRHDFISIGDKGYFIDGGNDYFRHTFIGIDTISGAYKDTSGNIIESLFLTTDNSIDEIQDKLCWGTNGIKGNKPIKYVKLIDCTTDHLIKILECLNKVGADKISHLHYYVIQLILGERNQN